MPAATLQRARDGTEPSLESLIVAAACGGRAAGEQRGRAEAMSMLDEAQDRRSSTPPAGRRRWSTRTRVIVGIVALFVVLWIIYAAVQVVRARQEAQTGIDQLESIRSSLTIETVSNGQDLDRLADANAHFSAANHASRSFALTPMRVLPVVGRQIHSVDALSHAAADVTAIAQHRLSQARELLDRGEVHGEQRVEFVRDIGQLARDSGVDLAGLDLGPSSGLTGPLARAHDRFENELASLRTSADHVERASAGVAALLEGPRNYLLLASNNSEMRVGSGTFLSAGVLSTEHGSFHLSDMQSIVDYNLPDDRVPLRGDLAARWGWLAPNREWRNLASSPRFDANGELAQQMWKAATGQQVDGVIALDVLALKDLLTVTGPVVVDGRTITSKNVLSDLMVRQYVRAAGQPSENIRREDLSLVANAVVDRLQNGDWEGRILASQLVDIAAGRHLLLWSGRTDEQTGWEAVSVAGEMKPNSVLFGVHNRGGNKLDQFLAVDADVSAHVLPDGTKVEVHLHMQNKTPTGLPQKIVGPNPSAVGSAEGRYQGLLVLQVPRDAQQLRIVEDNHPTAIGPDGNSQVIAGYVELNRGAKLDRTITFIVPRGTESLRIEPSARVPSVNWSFYGQHWRDGKAKTVSWG
jgi:hypothetical protein